MHNFTFASIKQLQKLIREKTISPYESVTHFKSRSEKLNPGLNALLEIFDVKNETSEGLLAGIPGAIKNNICINGIRTTAGSKILSNYYASYDATVVSTLKAASAPLLATANMDEFAMGSSTETSAFGPARNPWNTECVPGGSSGGSAAAVAAGMVPWALGTETGGSVRQPAALCGIVGLKPTYGLVSRYGLIAYGSSLDQVGIFSRTAYDSALLLEIMAGHDASDSTTLAKRSYSYQQLLDGKIPAGLKIGIIKNAIEAEGINPEILAKTKEAIATFQKLGAVISDVSLPSFDYSAAAYFIISRAEAASNLARFDGIRYGNRSDRAKKLSEIYSFTRHDGFGSEVRKRILVGNYVLSAGHAGQFYENAKRVVRLMRQEVLDVFTSVDLLIMPTSSVPAFGLGAYSNNKLEMDLQDYFTCPANLTGIPAISLPCGFTQTGLPIGFQLMAGHLQEGLLLQASHAYQTETDWHEKHPTI
jgi:aspartyl-tRNA(Asn)/glutamyl-tRNA(Gln) amidotransferase subunit A